MPRSHSPRLRAALRQLASGAQDHRDDALFLLINTELKKLSTAEVIHIRDRVRYSCPPCPMVSAVVDMINGLIAVREIT